MDNKASIRNDIKRKHGCLVLSVWYVADKLKCISLYYCWFKLARRPYKRITPFDEDTMKSKPYWQDIGYLVLLTLGTIGTILAWILPLRFWWVGAGIAGYVLCVVIHYLFTALWLDDLGSTILKSSRDVWSHRRILFVSITSFFFSILFFTALYRDTIQDVNSTLFFATLYKSFSVATTVSLESSVDWIGASQILFSLFLLAVTIATMASTAYRREELAKNKEGSNDKG